MNIPRRFCPDRGGGRERDSEGRRRDRGFARLPSQLLGEEDKTILSGLVEDGLVKRGKSCEAHGYIQPRLAGAASKAKACAIGASTTFKNRQVSIQRCRC